MSANEMSSKVKELRELKRMQEELAAEIESVQDAIKAEMTARNTDTLNGDDYKITWKEVASSRLDTAALKKGTARSCRPIHEAEQYPPLCTGVKEKGFRKHHHSTPRSPQNHPQRGGCLYDIPHARGLSRERRTHSMSNTNPFPQGSSKATAIDRVLSMTAEEAAAFLRFLEERERSNAHA